MNTIQPIPLSEGAKHYQAVSLRRMDTIRDLSITGIKGLTIINGGAIIALFTLVAQGGQSSLVRQISASSIAWAAGAFAAGLTATLFGNWLGFAAQQALLGYEQSILNHHFSASVGISVPDPGSKWLRVGNWALFIASLFGFVALTSFSVGCAILFHAILVART